MAQIRTFFLLIFLSCFLVGCQETSSSKKEKKIISITVDALGNTLEDIRFEPDTLVVPANSKIALTLINKSEPKAMFHNIVFCSYGKGQKVGFQGIQAGAKNDYVDPNSKDVIAYSKVIKPGEKTLLEFDTPPSNRYSFICSFPGHYSKMKGVLIVEEK